MQIEIANRYLGPPNMGHGGYVAGLFTDHLDGAIQVTLRRPAPLDVELTMEPTDDGRWELRQGEDVIAEAERSTLEIEVPTPPGLGEARAAEAGSPSFFDGRGVHGTCFGCSANRPEGDGMRVFAGPVEVDGVAQVAGSWSPGPELAGDDGSVESRWVLAALDCPGAFAYIVDDQRAGLLGRIVFEQYRPVPVSADLVVTGWQIGGDGRKMLAGTALADAEGTVLAAARATWFPFPGRG